MSSSLSSLSPEAQELKDKLDAFVQNECEPAEVEFEHHLSRRHGSDRWNMDAVPPCIERLKQRAKSLGLWNLFIPPNLIGKMPPSAQKPSLALGFREYGILCETIGRSFLAPEACNSSAPDAGNMEILLHFGSKQQKQKYLVPLLEGKIRSAFLMTETDVASSDATNTETKLTRIETSQGEVTYVLNGRKWWSAGAMDPRCKVALVLAKMDYSHPSCTVNQSSNTEGSSCPPLQTVVLVDTNHPGVHMVRPLTSFGYDDAPSGHAEVLLVNIELSRQCLIIGEGSGFQVAQARLGPGRIYHCMRSIGLAQRCYELHLARVLEQTTFGLPLYKYGGVQEEIADSFADLEAARLVTLECAAGMDIHDKESRNKFASIKVSVPRLAGKVVDRALQVHGGAGMSGDFILARALAALRALQIADGPDVLHKRTVAMLEIKKVQDANESIAKASHELPAALLEIEKAQETTESIVKASQHRQAQSSTGNCHELTVGGLTVWAGLDLGGGLAEF